MLSYWKLVYVAVDRNVIILYIKTKKETGIRYSRLLYGMRNG